MIDPRAEVHKDAVIGENVTIGPWTLIEKEVHIGDGTVIGSHVVIQGPTRIGKNNQIYQFASVGADPQDKKYIAGEKTLLEMGDENVIREFTTINRGTVQGGGITRIGNHNLFMASCHVAHDCIIGDHTILANYAGLAGHVIVEDWAIISAYAAIHQFCTMGAHAFIGNSCRVTQDVLPYLMVAGGDSPKPYGLNSVGLQRRGFSEEELSGLKKAYRIIFRQELTVAEMLPLLQELAEAYPIVKNFTHAIEKSTRGFVK